MLTSVTGNADWYYGTAFKNRNAICDVQLTVSHQGKSGPAVPPTCHPNAMRNLPKAYLINYCPLPVLPGGDDCS